MANGNSTSIDAGKPPRSSTNSARLASIAHDLSCVNGIDLSHGLDALKALTEVNNDWLGNMEAPINRQEFISLLACVLTQMQGAKNRMESLICELEMAVGPIAPQAWERRNAAEPTALNGAVAHG
jgi:hypothetical protein